MIKSFVISAIWMGMVVGAAAGTVLILWTYILPKMYTPVPWQQLLGI